jgi:hypothetical protein
MRTAATEIAAEPLGLDADDRSSPFVIDDANAYLPSMKREEEEGEKVDGGENGYS